MTKGRATALFLLGLTAGSLRPAFGAESYDPGLLREMRWRMIGPHRGGRTKAAAGIPDRPGVFYVGACNGGGWENDDHGPPWTPIFAGQPTPSLGALPRAPPHPDGLYLGSGARPERPHPPPRHPA